MGVSFAVLTAAFWGLYNTLVRKGGDSVDPGAGYLLTLLINVALNFFIAALPLPGIAGAAPSLWPVVFFILAGMSTSLLGRFFFFQAVFSLGPSRASAWKNAAPVYSLFLGALFLHEPFTAIAVSGVIVTLIGMWALAREQERVEGAAHREAAAAAESPNRVPRAGLVFGLITGIAFSVGLLMRRAGLLLWPSPSWGNAIGATAALVSWLPFAAAKGEIRKLLRVRGPGVRFWVMAGIFSSLAQLSSFIALRVLSLAVAQVVSSLEPIFTMVISLVVLGRREGLNRGLLLAVLVVCLGVALVVV